MGEEGAICILNGLHSNKSIISIDFSNNELNHTFI